MKAIKGFNGLRAISVLLVIASHGMLLDALDVSNPIIRKLMTPNTGVTFFFVLSGFLITLLLLKERELTGTVNLKNFYARRSLRIFPLYFLALSVVPVVEYFQFAVVNPCVYWYAYTYLYNFGPQQCDLNAYSHFWSLAVEEHFYLLWPFIFLFFRRGALPIVVAFALVAAFIGLSPWPSLAAAYGSARWTYPAAAPIAFGCVAAYAVCHPAFSSWAARAWVRYLFLAVGVVALVGNAYGQPRALFFTGLTGIVLYVYYSQDSLLVRALELRPLAYLGQISYGLYVWQGVLAGNGSHRDFAYFPLPLHLGIALTFVVAPLSYHFFEAPILRLKKRFAGVPIEPPAAKAQMTLAKETR